MIVLFDCAKITLMLKKTKVYLFALEKP